MVRVNKGVMIGNYKTKVESKIESIPKKKFRILIQERKSQGSKVEVMRSFMVYDFKGRTTADSLKKKLQKLI